MKMPKLATGTLAAAIALKAVVGSAATIYVPATADPWLAGMPDGSAASSGDFAPEQSPILVPGLMLVAGTSVEFLVSGGMAYGPAKTTEAPDGDLLTLTHHGTGAENGISDVRAPVDALMGVFLGADQLNSVVAPVALDFSTQTSRDFSTLSPGLHQVFYIGDGLTSSDDRQRIMIPVGATRLFLGGFDGIEWFDNRGGFSVQVVAPEPSTLALAMSAAILLAAIGFLRFRSRRQLRTAETHWPNPRPGGSFDSGEAAGVGDAPIGGGLLGNSPQHAFLYDGTTVHDHETHGATLDEVPSSSFSYAINATATLSGRMIPPPQRHATAWRRVPVRWRRQAQHRQHDSGRHKQQ